VKELSRPETYARLISYLDHENLAVRQLAFWHLMLLAPKIAEQVRYDPAGNMEERRQAVVEWRKRIPEGKVP
jgi:hypothetical protein